jgi:hypothetical protein
MLAGQGDFEVAEQSLAIAEELGLDDLRANALITLGTMLIDHSDLAGKAMIEEGLELALAGNYIATALRGYSNLGHFAQGLLGDQQGSLHYLRDAERLVSKLGINEHTRWIEGNILNVELEIGEWDECLDASDRFLEESTANAPHYHDAEIFVHRGFIRLARGDLEGARADQADGLAAARRTKDPQVLNHVLAMSAYLLLATGSSESAHAALDELFAQGSANFQVLGYSLGDGIRAADALGRLDDARTWLGAEQPSAWCTVGHALVDEEYVVAAELFDTMGAVRSAALARLRGAQQMANQGRSVAEQLSPAVGFFRSVGASYFVAQAEALLPASA